MSKRYIPWLIFAIAAIYYCVLSSKVFTWAFVSGDAGDWLAASTWWMVPQPVGSPLYILLGHFLNLFPGDLVVKMTICLSAIPSAITVSVIYLTVKKLTQSVKIGLVSAGVALGAMVLLTQSTVLEEYALTTLFLAVALWAYVSERKTLTALFLGLATAIHAIILPLVVIWLLLEARRWRSYLKPIGVYFVFGIIPYGLILILMALHAPPLLADYFSIKAVWTYLTGTSGTIIGNIAIYDLPLRIATFCGVVLTSIGLAAVPLLLGVRRPFGALKFPLAIVIYFSVYYITNLDPVAWTFLAMDIPALAILAGVGISKMQTRHLKAAVAAGAAALIIANGVLLNAGNITAADNDALAFKKQLEAIPEGSAVATYSGRYSLVIFWEMSQGRDIVPLLNNKLDEGEYPDYGEWLATNYGITGDTTYEIVQDAMSDGRPVYLAGATWDTHPEIQEVGYWEQLLRCCTLNGNGSLRELVTFSPQPRSDYWQRIGQSDN